jgi:hypothetical protein
VQSAHRALSPSGRSLGHEAAPKTPSAMRTVRLTRRNVEILGNIVELYANPGDYLLKNTLGEPIEQRSFYRLFRDAVRVLEIRPRDLYATKDTYVSVAITAGVNLTWLSDQTGVAETTLRKHSARPESAAADFAGVGVARHPIPQVRHAGQFGVRG